MTTDESPTAVLEVAEFYERVTALLERGFPKSHPTTIRGEIAKVYEKNHLYLDIVDAGSSASDARRPVLNAHVWTSKWSQLKRELNTLGVVLKEGVVVEVSGYADLYAPQGKVGFTVTAINVQDLLGDIARRRVELLARLTTDHVVGEERRNGQVTMSPVPLRLGLIASPGTEGYADFRGQLDRSPYNFAIEHITTLVQGEGAPAQIVAAIEELDTRGLDLICIVRGGGSKGDLACFDDESLARAIAASTTPVWTGIGHTGDISIADLAAHTFAITPTKLGETIVTTIRDWHDAHVRLPGERLRRRVEALLEQETEFLAERRRSMVLAVRDRLRAEARHLASLRQRLTYQADHVLTAAATSLTSSRQLLAAYDPHRRLAQGWALVTTATGAVVRSIDDVTEGGAIDIQLSNGTLGATITKKVSTT